MNRDHHYTAFAGPRRFANGDLPSVALAVKRRLDAGEQSPVLIFADETGNEIDLDLRGSEDDALARLELSPVEAESAADGEPRRAGPGRPKLGVVSREVTLLPRHWDWLAAQPGGASATLRRLVEAARRNGGAAERTRRAQEAAYKVMRTLAGNQPGFEEATRALFAPDARRLAERIADWPADVRGYVLELSQPIREPRENEVEPL